MGRKLEFTLRHDKMWRLREMESDVGESGVDGGKFKLHKRGLPSASFKDLVFCFLLL